MEVVEKETREVGRHKKILEEGETIVAKTYKEQRAWLDRVGKLLKDYGELVNRTIMGEAETLCFVKDLWDNPEIDERLHAEAVVPWDGDFWEFARAFTARNGEEQADVTIINKMRVWRTFKERSIPFPKTVMITETDNHGNKVLDEDGREVKREVPFDVDDSSYTKLLVTAKRAQDGLSDDGWAALVDPTKSVNDLKEIIGNGKSNTSNEDLLVFFYRDGFIYAKKSGVTVALVDVVDDNEQSEVFQDGIDRLFRAIGIRTNPYLANGVTL